MVKEAKNIDFYTTGKTPSEEDFDKISEWIKGRKEVIHRRSKTGIKQVVVAKRQIRA
jgi:hypothetical protein